MKTGGDCFLIGAGRYSSRRTSLRETGGEQGDEEANHQVSHSSGEEQQKIDESDVGNPGEHGVQGRGTGPFLAGEKPPEGGCFPGRENGILGGGREGRFLPPLPRFVTECCPG